MASHYLVDLFGNPVLPLANSSIVDVVDPVSGLTLVNGCFVVRIPDFVRVTRPANLGDLITQKYEGLLAYYAGFENLVFDDFIDPAHLDLTYAPTKARLGQRGTIALPPSGGCVQSSPYSLTWGGALPGPAQVVLTWEVGAYTLTDPKTGLLLRQYEELSASLLTTRVSFDAGLNWNLVTDGGVLDIPLGQQGTDFLIRFTSGAGVDLYLSSWALIY